jgi:hypothetical protein
MPREAYFERYKTVEKSVKFTNLTILKTMKHFETRIKMFEGSFDNFSNCLQETLA